MKITANGKTIQIDDNAIRALLNNDLDSAQKHGLMGIFWEIAEAHGLVDDKGIEIL